MNLNVLISRCTISISISMWHFDVSYNLNNFVINIHNVVSFRICLHKWTLVYPEKNREISDPEFYSEKDFWFVLECPGRRKTSKILIAQTPEFESPGETL